MAKKNDTPEEVIAVDEISGADTPAPDASGWSVKQTLKMTYPPTKGGDVRGLQEALIARGYACGKEGNDGIFGKATRNAVRAFQGSARLTVNGIAGKQTVTALGGKWEG